MLLLPSSFVMIDWDDSHHHHHHHHHHSLSLQSCSVTWFKSHKEVPCQAAPHPGPVGYLRRARANSSRKTSVKQVMMMMMMMMTNCFHLHPKEQYTRIGYLLRASPNKQHHLLQRWFLSLSLSNKTNQNKLVICWVMQECVFVCRLKR